MTAPPLSLGPMAQNGLLGKIWRDAKKKCDAQINDAKASLQDTLRSFKRLGAALLEAKDDDARLDPAVTTAFGWHNLESLVATAAQLSDTMSADPLNHVVQDITVSTAHAACAGYQGGIDRRTADGCFQYYK